MKLFFSFNGRINRAQWFLGQFVGLVFYIGWITYAMRRMGGVYEFTSITTKTAQEPFVFDPLTSWPFLTTAALWTWIFLATTAKRFHDQGFHGAWAMIGLFPMATSAWFLNTCPLCSGDLFMMKLTSAIGIVNYLLGPVLLVLCGFTPGDSGPNKYGPPPGSFESGWDEDDQPSEGVMPPSGFAKLDDAYFERYRASMASRQAMANRLAPHSATGGSPAKPSFGKR